MKKLIDFFYSGHDEIMQEEKEYTAYVCKTDWDYHFPDDWHGVDIYFSEKSIREHRKCVKECGIVKVKVSFEEVIEKGKL